MSVPNFEYEETMIVAFPKQNVMCDRCGENIPPGDHVEIAPDATSWHPYGCPRPALRLVWSTNQPQPDVGGGRA